MPSKIRVLTDHTINQIAAGEVIENPASVVKELVENSIDAGSTEICVEIKAGGRQLIRITDNGCGMNSDDALLCLERHATSKIKEVDDIHTIITMGFRGEAIPSIASISQFSLLTRAEGYSEGTLVIVDGGKIIKCTSAPRSIGTTIEVKSLFFNVPVRKKFQKSPQIDTNEILRILSTLALGHPQIKFELISNQEKILSTPLIEKGLEERIRQVLGSEFYSSLTPIDGTQGEIKLSGFIGLPAFTKQNRTGQYLFINHRCVTSPLISYAIREGFGTTLASNRHPIYVLHLSIPGHSVDVNVHPQKKEVRLRQEQDLKELIINSVESTLQNAGFSYSNDFIVLPPTTLNEAPAYKPYASFEPLKEEQVRYETHQIQKRNPEPALFTQTDTSRAPRVLLTTPNYILIDPQTTSSKDALLCLVDQRAAHARIIFEKLLQKKNSPTQPLLIPYSFETTPIEAAFIIEQLNFLQEMGIHIHQSGPQSFIVDSIPDFFASIDLHTLITDLVHDQKLSVTDREKVLAVTASRSALSKNKKLSLDEAQVLLNHLFKCQIPHCCPQGKATLIHMKSDEIEKLFKG